MLTSGGESALHSQCNPVGHTHQSHVKLPPFAIGLAAFTQTAYQGWICSGSDFAGIVGQHAGLEGRHLT